MRKIVRKTFVAAIASVCAGVAVATLLPAVSAAEPLQLLPLAGWLDEEPDEDAAPAGAAAEGKADAIAAQPIAERAAIVAAARQALATHAAQTYAILQGGAAGVALHATGYGPYVVRFTQRIDGVEVYGARVNVLLDRDLRVRAITGGTAPVAAAAGAAQAFERDAATSLRSAASAVDGLLAAAPLQPLPRDGSAYERFRFERSPRFVPDGDASVKRIWYPNGNAPLAAYQVRIAGHRPDADRPLAKLVVVAADDGRVLSSSDLVHDLQPFRYRVFADASGHPYVDPYGYTNPYPTRLPSGYLPDVPASMNSVSLVHAGISTGDPWLADDASETNGNNVDAFFNADPVNADGGCAPRGDDDYWLLRPEQGDFRAPLSAPRAFDYAYDAGDSANDFLQCPRGLPAQPLPQGSARLNAKIVQAFYAANRLHDLFYDLGFDEVAGNMQKDNYGRGGVGGDPLYVSAGVGTTFASVSVEDGVPAALYLGINTYTDPYRDVSALDFGVLAHEWSHTMFGRLTGLGMAGQQFALNEGIADFVGLLLSVRAQDRDAVPGQPPFHGNYAIGAYMNRDYDFPLDPFPKAGSPGYPDETYYHGIRRFPYSADLAINPLTFKHVGMDHPLPESERGFDWKGRALTNAEPHSAGEVWTTALWQCSRNLLAAAPSHRFEQARDRFLANLVASLKLLATDADYTDARDALLFAIRADRETDYRRCRAGFAERGFGAGAVAPDRHSIDLRGAVESFADYEHAVSIVGAELEELAGGDDDGVLDRGESGVLRVIIKNSGFSPLRRLRVRVDALGGAYAFPGGPRTDRFELAPGATYNATIDVRVVSGQASAVLPLAIEVHDSRHPLAHDRQQASFRVNYDLVRDRYVDQLSNRESFAADWISTFGESDGNYCYYGCLTPWLRASYAGEPAYLIGDSHVAMDAYLSGRPFLASGDPLRVIVRHDYDFDRLPGDIAWPGTGLIEISVDGGDWENGTAYLLSGTMEFAGSSGGWRDDTLDFGTALAGRRVQLRWRALIDPGYFEHFSHWAIARVEVQGAAEPMFSARHADVD